MVAPRAVSRKKLSMSEDVPATAIPPISPAMTRVKASASVPDVSVGRGLHPGVRAVPGTEGVIQGSVDQQDIEFVVGARAQGDNLDLRQDHEAANGAKKVEGQERMVQLGRASSRPGRFRWERGQSLARVEGWKHALRSLPKMVLL